jgi:hypothetical protein
MHYKIIQILLNYIYVIDIYYIGNNQIKDKGTIKIGNALQNNTSLTFLSLSNKYLLYYRW